MKKVLFSNYWGISLLPILSKVLERCVAHRLVNFTSDRLYSLQHSFRKGLSSTTQLLSVLYDIGRALDRGAEIDLIYLDITRAFDTVCHFHLLRKLQDLGISGSLFRWLSDYLSSRRQRVVLNGRSSRWECVLSGVPQGSVLGPILFILFINDLADCFSASKIAMFADDTKCYKVIDTLNDVTCLQQDLHSISTWACDNELSFQPVKCENLRISRKRCSLSRCYDLNSVTLKTVSSIRDLGVQVTKDLLWAEHIQIIISEANKMLGFLRRNCSNNVQNNVQKTLYIALVRSHFTYASQVWSPCSFGSIYLSYAQS